MALHSHREAATTLASSNLSQSQTCTPIYTGRLAGAGSNRPGRALRQWPRTRSRCREGRYRDRLIECSGRRADHQGSPERSRRAQTGEATDVRARQARLARSTRGRPLMIPSSKWRQSQTCTPIHSIWVSAEVSQPVRRGWRTSTSTPSGVTRSWLWSLPRLADNGSSH